LFLDCLAYFPFDGTCAAYHAWKQAHEWTELLGVYTVRDSRSQFLSVVSKSHVLSLVRRVRHDTPRFEFELGVFKAPREPIQKSSATMPYSNPGIPSYTATVSVFLHGINVTENGVYATFVLRTSEENNWT
jgi:hypothetical protein